MTVETATWPDDLEPANPASADPLNEGDDHARLTKQVIKNWAGSWGDQAIDVSAKAYTDAGDAALDTKIDANTAAIALKAPIDSPDFTTNAQVDGSDILTEANYTAKMNTTLDANLTPVMPADANKFLNVGGDVTISGTAATGNRLDIFAVTGDVDVTGLGSFIGFGTSGITLTVPGGFGASIIWNGTGWYVIGAGSIA